MRTHPFTTLTAVDGPTVRITAQGRSSAINGIDTVVLAGWHRPVTDLYFALKDAGA